MNRLIAQKRRYRIENMTTDEKMINLIDDIYDDIESKICENCIWYGTKPTRCGLLNIIPKNKYFGCNMFERKSI